jgi:hypothetical protein
MPTTTESDDGVYLKSHRRHDPIVNRYAVACNAGQQGISPPSRSGLHPVASSTTPGDAATQRDGDRHHARPGKQLARAKRYFMMAGAMSVTDALPALAASAASQTAHHPRVP